MATKRWPLPKKIITGRLFLFGVCRSPTKTPTIATITDRKKCSLVIGIVKITNDVVGKKLNNILSVNFFVAGSLHMGLPQVSNKARSFDGGVLSVRGVKFLPLSYEVLQALNAFSVIAI